MPRCLLLALAGLLSACATVPVQPPAAELRPVVDHHQHLWSEASTAFTTTPPLPPVQVPGPLTALLNTRVAPADAAALADIYTADALALDPGGAIFLRGRSEVAGQVGGRKGLRAAPVAFALNDSDGWVAGTFTEEARASTRHVSDFLMVLRREGGRWRIAAEHTAAQPDRLAPRTITADQLVARLDAAGVRRAVVLSTGYFYGSAFLPAAADEAQGMRAENDWAGAQAARYPERLVAFCGVNPLKPYAAAEIRRCADDPRLHGLKLHFANSGVNLLDPAHVEALRGVFRLANERRLPIVAHVWVPGRGYGARHSQIFLDALMPEAPEIVVQIAHLAGSGPGYGATTDAALAVFAQSAGDPRLRNVYFDVASNVVPNQSAETRDLIAGRLRRLGMQRILFGSDSGDDNLTPADAWAAFRTLPLTEAEFRTVAGNVAPYLR